MLSLPHLRLLLLKEGDEGWFSPSFLTAFKINRAGDEYGGEEQGGLCHSRSEADQHLKEVHNC